MQRVAVLLLILGLIPGLAGCPADSGPQPPIQYDLIVSSSGGGSVTTPGEGAFAYDGGESVLLVAEPDDGYRFVGWTGDVDTIANVNAAGTTISVNGDYDITANFAQITAEAVWDWYDLDAIRDNLSGAYFLMNDLDSTTAGHAELASATANDGKGWRPIGGNPLQGTGSPFGGTLYGQGHEISDAFINRPERQGVGLFDSIGETGVVKDLGIAGVEVNGFCSVGGLAGFNNGGLVSGCYFNGNVTGHCDVGGLLGWNRGTVSNSYSSGEVVCNGAVGGLVGRNEGSVSNCYSSGSVFGLQSPLAGGLAGTTLLGMGTVSDSFWDTEASGRATSAGGTGKTTAEMKSIATFSGARWRIVAVADPGTRHTSHTWNIVEGQTYPFLSWQPVS